MGRDEPQAAPTYTPPPAYTDPESKIPKELRLSDNEIAYKRQLQNNLANFDSAYAPQYALEEKAFTDTLKKGIFDTFDPIERQSRENIAARLGGLNNRAYVDAVSEIEKQKQDSIASQASQFILGQADRKRAAQNDLLNQIGMLNNTETNAYNTGLGLATPQNNYGLQSAQMANNFAASNYQNQLLAQQLQAQQSASNKAGWGKLATMGLGAGLMFVPGGQGIGAAMLGGGGMAS